MTDSESLKRLCVPCLSLPTATPTTWAQDFLWAKRMGGMLGDFAFGVTVDASGNVHTVGFFASTVDFVLPNM